MGKTILAFLIVLQSPAFAASTPGEVVREAAAQMMAILKTSDRNAKAMGFCKMVHAYVDANDIGKALLGQYKQPIDPADRIAVQDFMALVPSIVVTTFLEALSTPKTDVIQINPNVVAKGDKVGVSANIGSLDLMFIVSKTSLRITDAEYRHASLVAASRDSIQTRIETAKTQGQKPVVGLVQSIMSDRGIVACR